MLACTLVALAVLLIGCVIGAIWAGRIMESAFPADAPQDDWLPGPPPRPGRDW